MPFRVVNHHIIKEPCCSTQSEAHERYLQQLNPTDFLRRSSNLLKSLDNHPSSESMSRAILNQRFHSFPSLSNMFIIKLFKFHNVTSHRYNLSRRVVLSNKSIFALSQESILFLGKDSNHSLDFPLKEKGNSLSLIISPSTSL